MMSKDDLKKMDIGALQNEAVALKKEFFNLKLSRITGQLKDTSQFPKLRQRIAFILTLARQKQRAEKQAKV
jgi:large subunit ribosomal protein L29